MSDAPGGSAQPQAGARASTRFKAQWAAALYAVLFVAATLYAFLWQPLRPHPGAEPSALEAWLYPREENAFLRIPVVGDAVFRDVFPIPGTEHVWVVGQRGLIVHSADSGATWEQLELGAQGEASPVSTPAAPAADKGAPKAWRLPSLFEAAYAEEPPPEPDFGSKEANASRPTPEQLKQAESQSFDPRSQRAAPVDNPSPNPPSGLTVDEPAASEPSPAQSAGGDVVTEPAGEPATTTSDEPASIASPAAATTAKPNLAAVFFSDETNGLIEADSRDRFASSDGGRSWHPTSPTRQLVRGHTDPAWQVTDSFVRVQRGDGAQNVVVLGSSPLAFERAAKGAWDSFNELFGDFGDEQTRIARITAPLLTVGQFSVDEGALWLVHRGNLEDDPDRLPSPSPAPIRDAFFEDDSRGLVADEAGSVFATEDGAKTWRQLAHRRSPALWYYVVACVLLVFLVFAARELARPPKSEGGESISNVAASDRPLRVGDPDALGLGRIAAGLSEFLRNAATEPPLTVAITGPWGSGKSSLMGLLQADLQRVGYRPVWFNAWHHQKGEHLLASLFANIRSQAIPPLLTPEGIEFRARLIWLRTKSRWLVALVLIAAVGAVASIVSDMQRVSWFAESLGALLGAGDASGLDRIASLLGAAPSAAALLAFGATLWRSLRAFGLDPAKLRNTASADGGDKIEPGARYRFASEFSQVTQALAPRGMVIFIDDLDRCAKEHVVEVLEAVNFLAVSGDCFVVLGMEPTWVKGCIALSFADLASQAFAPDESEADRNKRRVEFAEKYLEKLINIQVRVPTPSAEAAQQILRPNAPPPKPLRERARASAREWGLPAALAAGLIAAALIGYWGVGPELPKPPAPRSEPKIEARGELLLAEADGNPDGARLSLPVQSAAAHGERGDGAVVVGEVPLGDEMGTLTLEQGTPEAASDADDGTVVFPLGEGGARLTLRLPEAHAGSRGADAAATPQAAEIAERDPTLRAARLDTGMGLLWLPLATLVLAAFAVFAQWLLRPPTVTHDSEKFRKALEIWLPWIVSAHSTPRSLKRFVNDLRHAAIQLRHCAPDRRMSLNEAKLVAFASVAAVRPEVASEVAAFNRFVGDPQAAFEAIRSKAPASPAAAVELSHSVELHLQALGRADLSEADHEALLAAATSARLA